MDSELELLVQWLSTLTSFDFSQRIRTRTRARARRVSAKLPFINPFMTAFCGEFALRIRETSKGGDGDKEKGCGNAV